MRWPCAVIRGTAKKGRRGRESGDSKPRRVKAARLRDVAGDAGQGVDDVAREQGKGPKDRDRDDGQDDGVLGHRLSVFTGEPVVELLHRSRPPWTSRRPDGRASRLPL